MIKGSRTLTLLALLGVFDASWMVFSQEWQNIGVSIHTYGVIHLISAIVLAYLRFLTTAPVGQK